MASPRPDEGGIGGTGFGPVAPEEDDSGIGGTGIAAHGDTGIIGTITGFASICVGDVEIHYGTDSQVEIDGKPATAAQLAVGQVAPGWLSIGGTRISVADDPQVSAGDDVRVTGRWDGTQLVAASIETRPRLPFDGRVSRVDIEGFTTGVAGDQLRVGSFVFDIPPSQSLPQIAGDARVRLQVLIQERRAIVQEMGVLGARPSRPSPQERAPGSGRSLDPLGPPGSIPRDGKAPRGEGPRPVEGRPQDTVHDASRPERLERPANPERPAPPERPPHIERPPLPDRIELPERPPRPEHPDIPRRP